MDTKLIVQKVLRLIPDAVCLYVFGSQASGTANTESDLDLAVLGACPLDKEILEKLRAELFSTLSYEGVDLVDLLRCPTTLAIEVIHGTVIWESGSHGKDPL